jgi:hypothetical protein
MSEKSGGTADGAAKKSSSGGFIKTILIFLVVGAIIAVVVYLLVQFFSDNDGSGGGAAPPSCQGVTEVPDKGNMITTNGNCTSYMSRDKNGVPFLRFNTEEPLSEANIWIFERDPDSGTNFYFIKSAYTAEGDRYLTQAAAEGDQASRLILAEKSDSLSFFISNLNGTYVLESNDRLRCLTFEPANPETPIMAVSSGAQSFNFTSITEEQEDEITPSDGGDIPEPPPDDSPQIWGVQANGKIKKCAYPCSAGSWLDVDDSDDRSDWKKVAVRNTAPNKFLWLVNNSDEVYRCALPCQDLANAEKISDGISQVNAKDGDYLWGIRSESKEENSQSLVRCRQPCSLGSWEDIKINDSFFQPTADVTPSVLDDSNVILVVNTRGGQDSDGNWKGQAFRCTKPCDNAAELVPYDSGTIDFINITDGLFGDGNNAYAVRGRFKNQTSGQTYRLYPNREPNSEDINMLKPIIREPGFSVDKCISDAEKIADSNDRNKAIADCEKTQEPMFLTKIVTVGKSGDYVLLERGNPVSEGGEVYRWDQTGQAGGKKTNISRPTNTSITTEPFLFTDISA